MKSGVEVGEKRVHLLLSETAGEGGHIAFAAEDGADDLCVCGRSAAGKRGAAEEIAEAGGWRLEGEIVFLVAVRASDLIEMLAGGLLGRELRLRMAAGEGEDESQAEEGL
jgi:hypothetical protein